MSLPGIVTNHFNKIYERETSVVVDDQESRLNIPVIDFVDDEESRPNVPVIDLVDDEESRPNIPVTDLVDDEESRPNVPVIDLVDDQESRPNIPVIDLEKEVFDLDSYNFNQTFVTSNVDTSFSSYNQLFQS